PLWWKSGRASSGAKQLRGGNAMPDLTIGGVMIGGVGGGIVSVDDKAVAQGGCAVPVDADSVIFNGPDPALSAWVLRRYRISSGQLDTLDRRRVSFIAAAGGRYAVQSPDVGLFANFPLAEDGRFSDPNMRMSLTDEDGRGAATPDGLIALCPDPSCA